MAERSFRQMAEIFGHTRVFRGPLQSHVYDKYRHEKFVSSLVVLENIII